MSLRGQWCSLLLDGLSPGSPCEQRGLSLRVPGAGGTTKSEAEQSIQGNKVLLSLSTAAILVICCAARDLSLATARCSAASLASTHHMPPGPLPTSCSSDMAPWQPHPWWEHPGVTGCTDTEPLCNLAPTHSHMRTQQARRTHVARPGRGSWFPTPQLSLALSHVVRKCTYGRHH